MIPKVDPDLCIGCGNCEAVCAGVFELGGDGISHVLESADCSLSDCCEQAADECPAGAISVEGE
jgi:ferredoxin